MNKQALTLEHHILATRQHGSQEDQLRLASFLFEEALTEAMNAQNLINSGGRSVFRPHLLVNLDLSDTRIQLFHVGICVNLKTLNLSSNFLTRLSTGGLARCASLTNLDLCNNHISDEAELEYLRFIPSLQVR